MLRTIRIEYPPVVVEACTEPAIECGSAASIVIQPQIPQLKPREPPKFEGSARHYPRFKQKFLETTAPHFPPQTQLEYLEEALPQQVKKRISTIKRSPEDIWRQLDEIFADAKTLADESLKELFSVSRADHDKDFTTVLYKTLIEIEQILKDQKEDHYLKYPSQVSIIEGMLTSEEGQEFMWRKYRYEGIDYNKLKPYLGDLKSKNLQMRKHNFRKEKELKDERKGKRYDHHNIQGQAKSDWFQLYPTSNNKNSGIERNIKGH